MAQPHKEPGDWKLLACVGLCIALLVVLGPVIEAYVFETQFTGLMAVALRGLAGFLLGLSLYDLLFRRAT